MIATEKSCPSLDELRDVACGLLPTERFTKLVEHVEGCPQCQSRLDTVAEDDSFVAALASPVAPDPLAAEPDCAAALYRAAEAREDLGQRSTPPVENLGVYRLLRPLGSGAMGAVYLAEHTRLRRRCAIKLLPRDRGFDAQWRERFDREMAAVAALSHPHVVAATDAGEASGWHYLVMEYLDGLDLGRLAARMPPLEVPEACELACQAAVGLAEIHAAGLVHRDIKPSNLMLTREGVVKILDLGLVMPGADPLPEAHRLTTVGHLMGTLAYMAPEQLADSQTVDFRADLYALGATLYRLLAGVAPHDAKRGLAPLVIAKTTQDAPRISEARRDLPKDLVRLVDDLLCREPSARGESALAVAERLRPLAVGANVRRLATVALRQGPTEEESSAGAASLAPVMATAPEVPNRPPRRPGWIAAAAGAPLLALLGIVMWIQTDRGQLVIESELDDVSVRVQQGEELVEALELETGENRVTLRSGTYRVTLDTPADGFRLSDDHATVTRGGEAVLTVRREATPPLHAAAAGDSQMLYGGKTLEYWLGVLEHERDVEMVVDAMTAAVELVRDLEADDDGLKMRTARSILQASRRFGAWGDGNYATQAPLPPPERFMRSMPSLYFALLPEPGLDALTEELKSGNRRSAMASLAALSAYANGHSSDYVSPQFGRLEQWSKSEEGRERLRALADALDTAVQRLGGYGIQQPGNVRSESEFDPFNAVGAAYQVRLYLVTLLKQNPFEIPEFGERLSESLEGNAAANRKLYAGDALGDPQFYRSLVPEEVLAAYTHAPDETVLWAGLPRFLSLYVSREDAVESVLTKLVQQHSEEAAKATVAALRYRILAQSGRYSSGPPPFPMQELWAWCIRNLAEHAEDPAVAVSLLSTVKAPYQPSDSSETQEMFGPLRMPLELYQAIDEALAKLRARTE